MIPMSDAPQVVYGNAPPEAYRDHELHQKEQVYPHYRDVIEHPQKHATVLGIRRRNFWILIIIAVVVIIAVVGGSVGGALAVRNSGSKSESTGSSQTTAPSTAQSSAGTPLPSASATASLYAPLPAASVTEIDISCPSSLRAFNDNAYDCQSDTNIAGGDITGIYAYSLQQCIDACSTLNIVQGEGKCKAVALTRDALADYRTNKGANCWLKNATAPSRAFKRATVALWRA